MNYNQRNKRKVKMANTKNIKVKFFAIVSLILLILQIYGMAYGIVPSFAYIYNTTGEDIYSIQDPSGITRYYYKVFPYTFVTHAQGEKGEYYIESQSKLNIKPGDFVWQEGKIEIPTTLKYHDVTLVAREIRDGAFKGYGKQWTNFGGAPKKVEFVFPSQKNENNEVQALWKIGDSAFAESCISGTLKLETPTRKYSVGANTYRVDVTIGSEAFYGCRFLQNVDFSNLYIKTIKSKTFSQCLGLKTVTLSSDVRTIQSQAFSDCQSLNELNLKEGLETIGVQAFYNCTSLTSVRLPKSLKNIENMAFAQCTNLKTVYISKDTKLGANVFPSKTEIKYLEDDNSKPIVSAQISGTQKQLTYSISSNASTGLKDYSVKSPSGKILAQGNYSAGEPTTSVSKTIKISESGTYTIYATNQNGRTSYLKKSCDIKTSESQNSSNSNQSTQTSSQTEYEKAYKNKGYITDFTYGAPQQQAPTLSADKNNAKLYIKVLDSDITSIAKFIVQRKENGKWNTIIDSKQALGAKCIQNMYSLDTVFGNNSKINYRILIYYIKDGTKYRYYTDEKTLSNPNSNNSNNSSSNSKPQTVKIVKPTINTFKIEKQNAKATTLRICGTKGTYGIKYYKVSTSSTYDGYAYYIDDSQNSFDSVNFTKSITKNGTYYLYLVDANGNYIRSNPITINNIDETIPKIENIKLNTTAPTQEVALSFKCSDSESGVRSYAITTEPNYQNVKFYYVNNDKSISKSKIINETIEENGTYYIYVKDDNDNIARTGEIIISNIDRIKPYFKEFKIISDTHIKNGDYRYITSNNTNKNHVTMQIITNEKVTIDKSKMILSGSGASKSTVQFTKINDTTYNITITAGSSNGKVSFYFDEGFLKDSAGNLSNKGSKTYSSIYVYNTAPIANGKVTQDGSKTTVDATVTGGVGQIYYKWIKGNDINNPLEEGTLKKYTEAIKLVTSTGEKVTLYVKDELENEKFSYYKVAIPYGVAN